MRVKTSDGKIGELTGVKAGKSVGVKLEDGTTKYYPETAVKPLVHSEKPPEIVIVPAIDRLEELKRDFARLREHDAILPGETIHAYEVLYDELTNEAIKDFRDKWGL